MDESKPLITCLCITWKRPQMLARAVHCFLSQTWPNRELQVICEDTDHATRDYLATIGHPMIRTIVAPASPHMPLGAKRQLSLEAARGTYVATWDDDDWSAPTRLADQMEVIEKSGRPACVLRQWIIHDAVTQRSWLAEPRTWEASLVSEKTAMPPYGNAESGEDFIAVTEMARREHLAALNSPHLYIYLYHGTNVGSRVHFKRNVFAPAKPLSEGFNRRVMALLASPQTEPPITVEELLAG